MTKHPFRVIEGSAEQTTTDKLKQARKARPDAAHLLRCHRCASSEVIETKVGMVFKAGKASGGTKQILCASCFMKGERVVLV
jgi:hypothetical protein